MPAPVRDFSGRVVGVALVVRLVAIMVALIGLVGETITGPLLACVLVLSITTFAMLMHAPITEFMIRHPLVLVADILLNLAVVWVLGVESPLVLATFPLALIIGVLAERRVAVVGAAVLCAGYYLVAVTSTAQPDQVDHFMTGVGVPALYASLTAIGVAVRSAHLQQVAVNAALADAQQATAAADERARLAREMHDSVGKTLHGLALGARGLVTWIDRDPVTAQAQATALAEGAEQAAREARALLVRMRRDEPDRPLAEVLGEMCGDWEAVAGVPCTFTAHDAVDLSTSARYDALAIVSEALENVARHAEAGWVRVTLDRDADGDVRLTVADGGRGFAVGADGSGPPGHFGLVGMHERAREIGAELTVSSAPGRGTTVRLVCPVDAMEGALDVR